MNNLSGGSRNVHSQVRQGYLMCYYQIRPCSIQFSSVTQSCLTRCDPMNRSTPGHPVHHQLPEFTQTYVHPQLGIVFALAPSLHSFWSCFSLISSSILGTYRPGEFLFQYPVFLAFDTVDGVLKGRILKWFAIPSSSGPHSVQVEPRWYQMQSRILNISSNLMKKNLE